MQSKKIMKILRGFSTFSAAHCGISLRNFFVRSQKILLYFDTGNYANPFDILIALDIGYDNVINYSNIDGKKAVQILTNAIFARNKKDLKNLVAFIGGEDIKKAQNCYNEIENFFLNSDMPKISVICDPKGIYTTSTGIFVKIKENIDIKNKKIIIFGGTGSIGKCTAKLLANHSSVDIASRSKEHLDNTLSIINNKNVNGIVCRTEADIYNACIDKEIIITTGAAGVSYLKKNIVEKLNPKLILDVSTIYPLGVENFEEKNDLENLRKKCICITGNEVGILKNKIEKKIFKVVLENQSCFGRKEILNLGLNL